VGCNPFLFSPAAAAYMHTLRLTATTLSYNLTLPHPHAGKDTCVAPLPQHKTLPVLPVKTSSSRRVKACML
jgi:hypothetical protein